MVAKINQRIMGGLCMWSDEELKKINIYKNNMLRFYYKNSRLDYLTTLIRVDNICDPKVFSKKSRLKILG